MVRLADAEREMVHRLATPRQVASQQGRRAPGLRKAEADGPPGLDTTSADACACSPQPVAHMRDRLVTAGCATTRHGSRQTRGRGQGLDGAPEAQLMA